MSMKNNGLFLIVIVSLILILYSLMQLPGIYGSSSGLIGRVHKINLSSKEVDVELSRTGTQLRMGQIVSVKAGKKFINLKITYPMMTLVKCTIVPSHQRYAKYLRKGYHVYMYINDSATVEHKTGETMKVGEVEFVWIPSGSCKIGARQGMYEAGDDEFPRHEVYISGFWISKYEITQQMYESLMGNNPSYFQGENLIVNDGNPLISIIKGNNIPDNNKLPVEKISWHDAIKFCKSFSKSHGVRARLPYEAEWEYACAAGSVTAYYWGEEVDGAYAWYTDNSGKITHEVGTRKPNQWGVYDMSGNVWEWCMDWYDKDYYTRSSAKNPHGNRKGTEKVVRGGSWTHYTGNLRISNRGFENPSSSFNYTGLRVVMED